MVDVVRDEDQKNIRLHHQLGYEYGVGMVVRS